MVLACEADADQPVAVCAVMASVTPDETGIANPNQTDTPPAPSCRPCRTLQPVVGAECKAVISIGRSMRSAPLPWSLTVQCSYRRRHGFGRSVSYSTMIPMAASTITSIAAQIQRTVSRWHEALPVAPLGQARLGRFGSRRTRIRLSLDRVACTRRVL